MGTDSIKLFNKTLANEIFAMEEEALTRFLAENVDALKRKKFCFNPLLLEMEQNGGSVSNAVERLLAEEYTLAELETEVARDLAFGEEEIYLDYWGCYVALFDGHPAGSISSTSYLPNEEEETFVLLQAAHVNQMIESLYEHIDDLRVMDREKIKKVEEWRDYCVANPGYMVAYLFDF
jgi:hypothetical protein